MITEHTTEVATGQRFAFGENWTRFLQVLNEDRIQQAEQSLRTMLGVADLQGQRFLDIGSGSGLFSLAARRLGAMVHSFDYDPQSVACTQELKRRYFPDEASWTVEEASVLDQGYLSRLGQYDVVYSWGVLHHTGALWQALENVTPLVAAGGKLFIAIYNDQGWISRYWSVVKRLYARYPLLQKLLLVIHAPYLFGLRWMVRVMTGRLALDRGMSMWFDMKDWIGGYPFEVAKPESIFSFYRDRQFRLEQLKTCAGRHGCNEFVFIRP